MNDKVLCVKPLNFKEGDKVEINCIPAENLSPSCNDREIMCHFVDLFESECLKGNPFVNFEPVSHE